MGFGGAAAAMATSLKNNNRRKERGHFEGLGSSDKQSQGIPSKPISEEALAEIRKKVKVEQRKERWVRILIFWLLICSLLSLLII